MPTVHMKLSECEISKVDFARAVRIFGQVTQWPLVFPCVSLQCPCTGLF
jgi:hypothetical protein